jgi:hypothetical protein
VAIAMFCSKHSSFIHSMCVHASVHTRISVSLDLVALVDSLLNNFSPNRDASFNHEYNTITMFIHKGSDTHEQIITLHTHHVYNVENL